MFKKVFALLLVLFVFCVVSAPYAQALEDNIMVTLNVAIAPSYSNNSEETGTYFPLWVANTTGFDNDLGYYIGVGIPGAELSDRAGGEKHSVTIVNAGATFKVNDNLILFGGPGYSYQRTAVDNFPTENRHRFNANLGAAWVGEKYGFSISYDSAPNAFGIGFTVRTGWFGSRAR